MEDGKMGKWMDSKLDKFSGSILVSRGGNVLIDSGYGFADKEKSLMNEGDTTFLIGSISKMVTSLAVMKLHEEGMLDINGKVNKYVHIEGLDDEIKITNLLNHTSGLQDFVRCGKEFDLYKKNEPNDIVRKICKMKRDFKVGEKFSYNNTGYLLLALLVETVSKIKYEAYVRKNIFLLLDMNDSSFISENSSQAIGHKKGEKGNVFHPSAFFGCGDIISTTRDLHTFIHGIREDRVISDNSFQAMKKITGGNVLLNYGYGMMITERVGEKGFGHSGTIPGNFSAQLSYYSESDLTIIVLCNDMRRMNGIIPGVVIAQYIERCLYEEVTGKKVSLLNKILF